jgi:hypothetical protein
MSADRRALGSYVDAETRARVAAGYDADIARRRIDRADEAHLFLSWAAAYSSLAHGSVVAGFEVLHRWLRELERLDDHEVVAVLIEGAE